MTQADPKPVALIIGASRGLGLAMVETYLARGWHVVATVRGGSATGLHALAAKAGAAKAGAALEIEHVDIAEDAQIAALAARLAGRRFDLLFVNAGISDGPKETIPDATTARFVQVMLTNALGPMRVIEALETLVPDNGTIGVMSSGLGSVANNTAGGWEVYRASKAALNTLVRSFAARHAGSGRTIMIIAPGWVRTDMGGPQAKLEISESIPRVVDVIAAHAGKPGAHYVNYLGETLPW